MLRSALLGLLLAAALPCMAADPPAGVDRAQAAYAESHRVLQEKQTETLGTLRAAHLEKAKPLLDTASDKGDFERAAAAWDLQNLIQGKPTEEWLAHPSVKRGVASWRAAEAAHQADFHEQEEALRLRLVTELEGVVTNLVRKELIDEAVLVRGLCRQVDGIPPGEPVELVWVPIAEASADTVSDAKQVGTNSWSGNILLHLGFESTPKSPVFFDDGPKKHRCKVNGNPLFVPGKKGQGLRLEKIDDFIDVKPFTLGPGITMAGWVHYDRDCQWGHVLKMSDPGKRGELAIYCDGTGRNLMSTVSGRGGDKTDIASPATCRPKTWIHILATCDRTGNIRLYNNGRLIQNRTRDWGISSHARAFVRVGRDFNHAGAPSKFGTYGVVDEIVVLDRALRENEIEPFFLHYGGSSEEQTK